MSSRRRMSSGLASSDETTEEIIARKELVIRKLLNHNALSTTLLLLLSIMIFFSLEEKQYEKINWVLPHRKIVCFIEHTIKQELNINKMFSFLKSRVQITWDQLQYQHSCFKTVIYSLVLLIIFNCILQSLFLQLQESNLHVYYLSLCV